MSADRGFWLSVCLDSCSRVSTPHRCTTGNVNHDHLWNLAPVTLRLVKSHYKTPFVLKGFYKVKRDHFISLNNDVSLFVCSKKNDYQRVTGNFDICFSSTIVTHQSVFVTISTKHLTPAGGLEGL